MSSGEQSVGKSYALNHFVDTSFAGSAMRCTEGVWLSVTPTQDALVVSMDFEGTASFQQKFDYWFIRKQVSIRSSEVPRKVKAAFLELIGITAFTSLQIPF